jgi:hypothetical protein
VREGIDLAESEAHVMAVTQRTDAHRDIDDTGANDPVPPPVVACVDPPEALAWLITEGGNRAWSVHATRFGPGGVARLLLDLRPDVCIYSIAPPYAAGWRAVHVLRAVLPACAFVVATAESVTSARAREGDTLPIVRPPTRTDQLADAISRALVAQPRPSV